MRLSLISVMVPPLILSPMRRVTTRPFDSRTSARLALPAPMVPMIWVRLIWIPRLTVAAAATEAGDWPCGMAAATSGSSSASGGV